MSAILRALVRPRDAGGSPEISCEQRSRLAARNRESAIASVDHGLVLRGVNRHYARRLLLVATTCLSTRLEAQIVRGSVIDSATSAPVAGAIVTLVATRDLLPPPSMLTDERGRFAITALREDQYALDVKRIGVKRVRLSLGALSTGETRELTIRVASLATEQVTVVVTEERRCALQVDDGSRGALLWDDVRAALEATELTVTEHRFSATLHEYARDLAPESGRVVAEHRTERRVTTAHPYVSATPAELSAEGYVIIEAGNLRRYRAPDARVLLSDAFIREHCFRLIPGPESQHVVGLGFEPIPARRIADIAGTLWINSATHELQSLEFHYVHEPAPRPDEEMSFGGQVHFRRLLSGQWIVSEWQIRAPILELQASPRTRLGRELESPRVRVAAIRKVGGTVVAIEPGLATRDSSLSSGSISGVAFDSTRDAPLANAIVALAGTNRESRTTKDGRFRLEQVEPGRYSLTLAHARIDSLGVSAPSTEVVVQTTRDALVVLAIPTWSSVRAALCPHATVDTTVGVLRGTVRDAAGQPQRDATVQVSWSQFETITGTTATLTLRPIRLITRTDSVGRYVLCDVRGDHPLQISAIGPSGRGRADARIAKQRVGVVDLMLAR